MLVSRPRTRVLLLLLLGAFVLGSLVSLLVGPRSTGLGSQTSGDEQLARDVRASLVDDHGLQTLSVARIADGRTTFAGIAGRRGPAPTPQTSFEMGSITKTITGSLLAVGVERGELRLDDPVARHLSELTGTPAGAVTLRQLATHTGGLPPFPESMQVAVLESVIANTNTYEGPTAAMLESTRTTALTDPGTYRYSNLGMSLLGHAEARAAGAVDWPTLATDRILTPLGMSHTSFAVHGADVPADAARPHLDNGWTTANWWGPAFAPAGSSTWTTAEDLVRYAGAQLDATAPGATAMDPLMPIPSGQIGLAWHLIDVDGVAVTWHNGATGGYRTIVALDRAKGQAVVILSNSTRDADTAGRRLAATPIGSEIPRVDSRNTSLVAWTWPVLGLVLLVSFGFTMLRGRNRLALVTGVLTGVAGLIVLLTHGPWAVVPAYVWGGLAAVSVVLVGLAVRRGRALPAYAERRRAGWLSLVSAVILLALVVWMA